MEDRDESRVDTAQGKSKDELLKALRKQQAEHQQDIIGRLADHAQHIEDLLSAMSDGCLALGQFDGDASCKMAAPEANLPSVPGANIRGLGSFEGISDAKTETLKFNGGAKEARDNMTNADCEGYEDPGQKLMKESNLIVQTPGMSESDSNGEKMIEETPLSPARESSRGSRDKRTSVHDCEEGQLMTMMSMSTVPAPPSPSRHWQPAHRCFILVVEAPAFEPCSIFAVFANAIVLGVQADWSAKNEDGEMPVAFEVLEMTFTVAFTIELILRILASGKFFCSTQNHELSWNVFDCLLVSSALIEIPFSLAGDNALDLTGARLLRIMRLARILRIVRVFRFFKMLRLVIQTVAASLKPLLWAMMLLFIMIFISSVMILQLIQDKKGDDPRIDEFYGSLISAHYTLFACITAGIGWSDAAEPLVKITMFFKVFFVIFISFSFFCVVNIVTSIFVESAKAMNMQDDEMILLEEAACREKWMNEIADIFAAADADGSGDLTVDELEERMHDLRVQILMKNVGIDVMNINPRGLFHSLDFDGSGSISITEFTEGIMRFHGHARSLDLAEVRHFTLQCLEAIETVTKLIEPRVDAAKSTTDTAGSPPGAPYFEHPSPPITLPCQLLT